MGCLHRRKVTSIIEIPEGYEVESLPEPTRVILPEKSMVFQYSITQNLNQVQVLSHFQTAKATYSPGDAGDRLMLRKAYAGLLLQWRGHQLPSVGEDG